MIRAKGAPLPSISEEIELQRQLVGGKKLRYSLDFSQYYHRWYNQVLLGLLAPRPESTVLDCGCGTGILLPALEESCKTVIGLDLSADNLSEARTVTRRAQLVVADMGRPPFLPGSIDRIVCRAAMYRLPEVRPALVRLFDVLRDGGDLVMTEPISDSPVVRFVQIAFKRCATRTHASKEWIRMAEAAGFRTERWFPLGYLALPLLGYPEETHIMRFSPVQMPLARLLLWLDQRMGTIPWIKAQAWHGVFHFRKPSARVRPRGQ